MVGEGIETCLAAMQATGHPAWAALSTSGLRALDLPDDVRDVIVLADGDDPGEAAARDALCAGSARVGACASPARRRDWISMICWWAARPASGERAMSMTMRPTENLIAAAIDAAEEIRDPLEELVEQGRRPIPARHLHRKCWSGLPR